MKGRGLVVKILYRFAGLMIGNLADVHDIIKAYQNSIRNHFIVKPLTIDVKEYFGVEGNQICLVCFEYPRIPVALWRDNGKSIYQYDLRSKGYGRPKAWRVPFLEDPNYYDEDYTVSHLCHNTDCYNWEHHVLEPLYVNKSRNGCPGGLHCYHKVTCIRPGPNFNW